MSTTGWIILFLCLFVFSVVIYNWKSLKAYFARMFKFNNNKKDESKKGAKDKGKNKKSKSSKLKVNENQIRPVLKPPEQKQLEHKAEEGKKETELPKDNTTKSFDFKLSSTPRKQDTKEIMTLKTDLDKEFDEIRKFLDLPQPINIRDKNVKTNIPATSREDKLNSNVGGFNPASSNDFVKGVGRAGSTANSGKFPYNSRTTSSNSLNSNSSNINVSKSNNFPINSMRDHTQLNTGVDKSFNNRNLGQNLPNGNVVKENHVENKVVIDGEEIDLNKLPLNIKRLLVSNILARKNYDD